MLLNSADENRAFLSFLFHRAEDEHKSLMSPTKKVYTEEDWNRWYSQAEPELKPKSKTKKIERLVPKLALHPVLPQPLSFNAASPSTADNTLSSHFPRSEPIKIPNGQYLPPPDLRMSPDAGASSTQLPSSPTSTGNRSYLHNSASSQSALVEELLVAPMASVSLQINLRSACEIPRDAALADLDSFDTSFDTLCFATRN